MVNKTERSVWRRLEQWVKKLKCSGSSGISLETFKDINVGDVSHSQNNPSSADEIEIVKCNYYLRRRTLTCNSMDRKWILVESEDIL